MYKDIKNLIVKESYELFKEKGYEQTTIMDICKKCGITKPTFYRYINSKEDLLAYFFNDLSDEANDLLLKFATASNYYEAIAACFDIVLDRAILVGPELYSQLYIANLKEDRKTFDDNNLYNDIIIALIEKGQQSGDIQNMTNPIDLFEACANLCFGASIRWCINPESFDFKDQFHNSLSILLNTKK